MFDVDGKFAGRSKGRVIDNVDPFKRGRIRVQHPLLGESVWIPYLKAPHSFDVPSIGDIVFVECDCGSQNHPVAHGNVVSGEDTNPNIPDAFKRTTPSNHGFYTPDGHLIEYDDGEGLLKTGKGIRFTASNGTKLHISAEDDSLISETTAGDRFELSADNGLLITTPSSGGTKISLKDGVIELSNSQTSAIFDSSGDIEIKNGAGGLKITAAGQVELKGAQDGLVDLIVQAFQALSTQTAPGFGSPTSTVADFAQLLAKAQALKAT
jgi:phage baseplate assembly protein gpV